VKFHHIGITVTSLERTLEFFDDAFALVTGMVLQVQAGTRTAAALGLPKHQHRLGGVALSPVDVLEKLYSAYLTYISFGSRVRA
jgi:catechol 2,3-dioxygenase-like lactoylglutathione lyase family enzyme